MFRAIIVKNLMIVRNFYQNLPKLSIIFHTNPYLLLGYVNVCAAVCLLLLVCGLSPRSSAAPHRSRASMERQRRDTDEENSLWANPCDYNDSQVSYFS